VTLALALCCRQHAFLVPCAAWLLGTLPQTPPTTLAPLLCSYTPCDTFAKDSPQYRWLEAELAATDRATFPWLIVNFHAVSGRAGWAGAVCRMGCCARGGGGGA